MNVELIRFIVPSDNYITPDSVSGSRYFITPLMMRHYDLVKMKHSISRQTNLSNLFSKGHFQNYLVF